MGWLKRLVGRDQSDQYLYDPDKVSNDRLLTRNEMADFEQKHQWNVDDARNARDAERNGKQPRIPARQRINGRGRDSHS